MHEAWNRGVAMAGLSAGAMCWFQGGISMSGGAPEPVRGLGMLQGSLSVHLDGEVERLPAFRVAVASGELPPGYAADDGAALLYVGTGLRECVASHPGARVVHFAPDGSGGVQETDLAVHLLPGALEPGPEPAGAFGVAEMRELRAGRHRWD
jgi:peptidase E